MKGYGRLAKDRLAEGDAASFVLKGGHDIWSSPQVDTPFTVPVDIDSRRTANKILKDAGSPKAF